MSGKISESKEEAVRDILLISALGRKLGKCLNVIYRQFEKMLPQLKKLLNNVTKAALCFTLEEVENKMIVTHL